MHILKAVWEFILTFFTFLSLLFSNAPLEEVSYEAQSPTELVMSFSIISDTHVETTDSGSYKNFTKTLRAMKAGRDIDAAVFLGDNVMNGQSLENFYFYNALDIVEPAEHNLVALGNHDIGNGEGDYGKLCGRFLKNNSKKLDNHIDKPYYYKIINGCYMIFLASEDLSVHECVISNDQLVWLKGLLDEADRANAPIFVFNHHPILMIDGEDWFKLIDLLGSYDNLIYFCGHTHKMLDEYSFRMYGKVRCVFLPRASGADGYGAGDGIVVEVYKDSILIKPRNFIRGEWMEELFVYCDIE